MLVQWGTRSLREQSNALGYPRICVMLKDGIPTSTPYYEPNEISKADYDQLQASIERLERKHQLVLIRAYRPWRAKEMEDELSVYTVTSRTWLNWLHDAAALLLASMNRQAA
jgi:hypothetical protein